MSDDASLVLHALRLKGIATTDVLVAVTGVAESVVPGHLERFAEQGWVILRQGRLPGWAITPAGRAEHAARLSHEIEESGHRSLVAESYEAFLPLNRRLLEVCTAWQVKDLATNQLNDHLDEDYDRAVIADLQGVHGGVTPICAQLGTRLRRYARYHPRFEGALDRVVAGLTEWFARPLIDSYHTVWMELHEDLLATLRIDRASESGH